MEKSAVLRRLCLLLLPPPPVWRPYFPTVEEGEAASELSSLLLLFPWSPVYDDDDGPGDARLWRTSATLKPWAVCLHVYWKRSCRVGGWVSRLAGYGTIANGT